MWKKAKNFLSDSIWSVMALVFVNAISQFVVYPTWNRQLGADKYGTILSLVAVMNIFSISVGSAVNYTRMTTDGGDKKNNPYLAVLFASSLAFIIVPFIIYRVEGEAFTFWEPVLFWLLMCSTMFRYYLDVEYRLTLNYRGYFFYYFVIGIGYLVGTLLFRFLNVWILALLAGELLSIICVRSHGHILTFDHEHTSIARYRWVATKAYTIFTGNMISSLVFNGDRLLLNFLLDGTSVTIYYLASLLGKTMSLITTPLNSVIIGYLARYKGHLTTKIMNFIVFFSFIITILATALCWLASDVLIPILYPKEYDLVKPFFVLANLSQILYFISGAISALLLRFSKAKYQVYINVIYAAVFLAACIPLTARYGMYGFCDVLLIANIVRFSYAIMLGYFESRKALKAELKTDIN